MNPKRYHGFLGLPRHSKMLLSDLGYLLYGFYIGLVMEAIWFRGNPDIGYIVKTQLELSQLLGCDQSTVSRHLQELEDRKYLVRHTKYKKIKLKYLPLFFTDVASKMHSKDYANLHEMYVDMHRIDAELQEKYVLMQQIHGKNPTQRLYNSSSDNLSSLEESVE